MRSITRNHKHVMSSFAAQGRFLLTVKLMIKLHVNMKLSIKEAYKFPHKEMI